MALTEVVSFTMNTADHHTHYLAAGPETGPVIIFVHGWPELSLSWRHQLPCLASLGFRAVAPDMRGYGQSSVYDRHEDYCQELIVGDMLQLLDHLGSDSAVWVGHDWGSPVVWNLASHHPEKCRAVASLCVPYHTIEYGLDYVIDLVNRDTYPQDTYAAGQWEYMKFYEEHFDIARSELEANVYNTVKLLFRRGDPAGFGRPSGTAMTRINGGWFGDSGEAPDVPRDEDVVTEEELETYVESLSRNGFFGANSWYMNHRLNQLYGESASNEGYLDMPCLFIAAEYDYTCESITSRLPEPMKTFCRDLSIQTIKSGHWMAQEKPLEVNAVLVNWLARSVRPGLVPLKP